MWILLKKRKIILIALIVIALVYTGLCLVRLTDIDSGKLSSTEETAAAESSAAVKQKLRNSLRFPTKNTPKVSQVANSTLVVVEVLSQDIWESIPPLFITLLAQWPHHIITSDSGAIIGKHEVVDVISQLKPDVLRESDGLNSYRIMRYGNDQNWGWAQNTYITDYTSGLGQVIHDQSLELASAHLRSEEGKELEWVVLCSPKVFFSAQALAKLETIDRDIITEDGKFTRMHREVFLEHAKSKEMPKSLRVVKTGNFSTMTVTKENWCEPMVAFSDIKRWEMQSLFEREVREEANGLGSGVYRDLILPHVRPVMANWEIFPSLFLANATYMDTYKDCLTKCEENSKCLGWQWHDSKECGLEFNGVRRGMAMNSNHARWRTSKKPAVSGWMVERIRNIRINAKCDDLELGEDGSPNDTRYTSEGWFQLMKAEEQVQKLEQHST